MSKQGLIYEIVCNETGERYIGSTFEPTIARRIVNHRRMNNSNCCSKQIIVRDNYRYGLLENVNVISRDELRMKEREWFDKLDCINKIRPFVSVDEIKKQYEEYQKEYYNKNKQELKEYYKERYKQNKDKKSKINI